MTPLDDTICAIATPIGEGGVGIVRMSGPHAFAIASKNIRLRVGKSVDQLKPFRMYLGAFLGEGFGLSPSSYQAAASVLDEVLVVIMRGPKSYTGEDTVEVHCHGGTFVVHVICQALIQSGARLAEPGEFTKRAFLNGRLDLTQAEAVLDTIRASSLHSLKLAQEHLQGRLSEILNAMRESLLRAVAHLEAGMDFVEDDIQFIDPMEIKEQIQGLILDMDTLIDSGKEGRIIREGVRTVIMGKPNVGKSSLLNAFLGVDRAIVSRIPGTTRDVLEEAVMMDGLLVRFFDTAGLRESPDEVELEGMKRARLAVDQADLVMVVLDKSLEFNEKDLGLITYTHEIPYILVLNKSDLPEKFSRDFLEGFLHERFNFASSISARMEIVEVSAISGVGLPKLKNAIKKLTIGNNQEVRDSVVISRFRHSLLLKQAREALGNAVTIIDRDDSPECLAMELRAALHCVGEIIGTVTSEDILDQVFRDFCIGK
jgi:tRNA modification GTPase